MFLRRIVEHLKAQHWTAVALDLAVVIVGVFIGTQVSNWNQDRIEKREAERLLLELRPALQSFTDFLKRPRTITRLPGAIRTPRLLDGVATPGLGPSSS